MLLSTAVALTVLVVFIILFLGVPLFQRAQEVKRLAEVREQLAKMRFAAGAHAHLPRKVRRARARAFAKKLTILARVTGTTAGLPRHEVRRRQRGLANAIARVG